jgi:hypothetical protein
MLEVFTVPESGLMKETYSTALETELMDSVGINGELGLSKSHRFWLLSVIIVMFNVYPRFWLLVL